MTTPVPVAGPTARQGAKAVKTKAVKTKAVNTRAVTTRAVAGKPVKAVKAKRASAGKVPARKPPAQKVAPAKMPPASRTREVERTIVRVRELDPWRKCGPGTSVERLIRVDEQVNGGIEAHLVFLDRHGWYCEHGRTCHAVGHARKHKG